MATKTKAASTAASTVSLQAELAGAVDTLYARRTERLAAQKAVDLLEAQEKEIRASIERILHSVKLDSAHGERAQVYFTRIEVPQLVDDEAFFEWARKKANRDVMKVGVNNEAWRLRLADGVKVPGTESFLKETLQVKGTK